MGEQGEYCQAFTGTEVLLRLQMAGIATESDEKSSILNTAVHSVQHTLVLLAPDIGTTNAHSC